MSRFRFWSALALVVLVPAALAAEPWTPYNFQRAERYGFTLSMAEMDEVDELLFALDIRESAPDPETGEPFFDISFTTSARVPAGDLQGGSMFLFGVGASYSMMAINPMALMFLGMADLEVGSTADLFGAREGYVVRMIMVEEGEEMLISEMVIDPELALPLRSVTYANGELVSVFLLTSYSR